MKDLINEIVERAEETKKEPDNEVNFGRKLAFVEVMAMFKRYLVSENPEAPEQYGLNFDVDKRFL